LEKQFKIITVCAAAGSGHPYIAQSDIQAYIERKQKQSKNTKPSSAAVRALQQWPWVPKTKQLS
jgi:hypothetical protein